MKVGYPSRLRVLLIALIFSTVMILGQTKRAEAFNHGLGEAGLVFLAVAAVATYVTVMGVACTPIATAKASDYPGGFSGAFGDCFTFELKSDQTVVLPGLEESLLPHEVPNDASDKPAEANEEDE